MNKQVEDIANRLSAYYPLFEAKELALWVLQELTGRSRFDILCGSDTKTVPNVEPILQKLYAYEPIQYIFGHTEWLGMDLRVSHDTLIPRPETAELVEHVSEMMHEKAGTLLDVGTGCGCIAIALKQRHPAWQIEGMDVSASALRIAADNAVRMNAAVHLFEADLFTTSLKHYDIIVSNPPYITPSERDTVTTNTLLHEPHKALFVPEEDPLCYYRCIARQHAAPHLWFEISETKGDAMLAMMRGEGYDAQCIHDMYDKPRFIYGSEC